MAQDITHYSGRFLSLHERDGWEFASRSNASCVVMLVAVTPDAEIVLVEQYREPVSATVIELPAGLVGDNDDPEESILDAARRELVEETGYAAARLRILMACPSSAGMSDEIVSFVVATDLRRVGPGGGDDSESIEVLCVPLAQVDGWLARQLAEGRLLDPRIYAALYWLRNSDLQGSGGAEGGDRS
jgi:ADP-ribose pyrophosphatase